MLLTRRGPRRKRAAPLTHQRPFEAPLSLGAPRRGNVRVRGRACDGGGSFDSSMRAFNLPSRNAGFVEQGYDWKTIVMIPRYYGGSAAWGHAANIRAAEVPTDCKVKARTADREFDGAEYVRNGPPDPVLALLKSMLSTIGLVVGARRELSCSAKQFVSDCAEKGSISPERFGCCHGEDQAQVMLALASIAIAAVCFMGVWFKITVVEA